MSPFREVVPVPVEGGSLRVGRSGAAPSAGVPAVLAAHGITANRFAWSPVARLLGERVCLLAPDLRGRGDSAGIAGPFGIAAHAADLRAILDHLEIAHAPVAGHSMGAFVAAFLAASEPTRVRALVLVDGGLPLAVPEAVDPGAVLAALLGPALVRLRTSYPSRAAYRDFWRSHPALAGSDVDDTDLAAYADHDLGGGEGKLRPRVREEAVREDGAQLVRDDAVRTVLHRVDRPTTLLRAPRGLMDDPNPLVRS
jgi:pimeloyl-ACP methyl ester carboxylesterase